MKQNGKEGDGVDSCPKCENINIRIIIHLKSRSNYKQIDLTTDDFTFLKDSLFDLKHCERNESYIMILSHLPHEQCEVEGLQWEGGNANTFRCQQKLCSVVEEYL